MRTLATSVIALGVIGFLSWFVLYLSEIHRTLPDDAMLKNALHHEALPLATEVFDRDGRKIGEFARHRRYYLSIDQIPQHVKQAFISSEDRNFHRHNGLDVIGIARALWTNIRQGRLVHGGSTITQQVARSYFLTPEKTIDRKIREALVALRIEESFTKNQILEIYLNKIYLGNGTYGVEAASREYFGKPLGQIDIAEAALLAALPQAPSRLNPRRGLARVQKRQEWVLKRMTEDGYLNDNDLSKWKDHRISLSPRSNIAGRHGYFMREIQQELQMRHSQQHSFEGGLKIRTTLDEPLQEASKTFLRVMLDELTHKNRPNVAEKGEGEVSGALVSLDAQSGEVLAMQGGYDFNLSQFNRATQTRRPLGGLFDLFTFAVAIEQGYGRRYPEPTSSSRFFQGILHHDRAFAYRLFLSVGSGTVQQFAKRLGLFFRRTDLSIGRGQGQATPLSVVRAFRPVVGDGVYREAKTILQVSRPAEENSTTHLQATNDIPVLSRTTPFTMRSLLRHASSRTGIGQPLHWVGTTDDRKNLWLLGQIGKIVTVFWLGSEFGRLTLFEDRESARRWLSSRWRHYLARVPARLRLPQPELPPSDLSYVPVATAQGRRMVPIRL